MMFVKFQDRGTRTLHALPKERSEEFCSSSCLNVAQCDGSHCWAARLISGQSPTGTTAAANAPRRGAAELDRIVRDTERRRKRTQANARTGTRAPGLNVVEIY